MTTKARILILAATLALIAIVLWQIGLFSRRPLAREEMEAIVITQAQQFLDAMFDRDFQAWADRTLPAAIEQAGGREKWIESMKKLLKTNEEFGVKMGSVKAKVCTGIAERESIHYAAVVYEFEITVQRVTSVRESVLVAASTDGGRNWKFAEGSTNRNRLMAVVPNFPNDIPLPKDLQYRVTRKEPIGRKRPKPLPKEETKPLAGDEMNSRIKTQAQQMFDAMVKEDLKSWEERTLPEVIEYHGGGEKWLSAMKEQLRIRQKVGINIDRIKAGEIVGTQIGNPECYGVIAYTLATTYEGKQTVQKGSLIGASTDGGRNWTFVVGGGFAVGSGSGLIRYANLSELIPDWPKDLPIPN